jgi:AAA ATPase domain
MGRAELKRLTLERFKSYSESTSLEIAPLTILLGRNNSGKSSLIQALLLLKQTLAYPRSDVPLHLEGVVEAINLRELTFGWPEAADFEGPTFQLDWESNVDVSAALSGNGRMPDLYNLRDHSCITWISDSLRSVRLKTTLRFRLQDNRERIALDQIDLRSRKAKTNAENPSARVRHFLERYVLDWNPGLGWDPARHIDIELDHFIPLVNIDKRNIGPRHRQRTYFNGFKVLYEQPLDDLRRLLTGFHYLGSTRMAPPSIYRPATVPPDEVGVNGEYAAQLLHARKIDSVHFVPPLALNNGDLRLPDKVLARPLPDAFNLVLRELGIDGNLNIHDVENVGFRLLFG